MNRNQKERWIDRLFILYIYRFLTVINGLRLRGQSNEEEEYIQTVPLLESSVRKLQCSLDDLEMAATFNGKSERRPNTACYFKKFNNKDERDRYSYLYF
jgi:hypothetical protein